MLGRRGYRMVNSEEATRVCPDRYCPGNTGRDRRSSTTSPATARNACDALDRRIARPAARRSTSSTPCSRTCRGSSFPRAASTAASASDPVPGLASPRGFDDPDLTKVQHAAAPAPGRLRGSPARTSDRADGARGHLEARARRGHRRPRLRVPGGRREPAAHHDRRTST